MSGSLMLPDSTAELSMSAEHALLLLDTCHAGHLTAGNILRPTFTACASFLKESSRPQCCYRLACAARCPRHSGQSLNEGLDRVAPAVQAKACHEGSKVAQHLHAPCVIIALSNIVVPLCLMLHN